MAYRHLIHRQILSVPRMGTYSMSGVMVVEWNRLSLAIPAGTVQLQCHQDSYNFKLALFCNVRFNVYFYISYCYIYKMIWLDNTCT